MKQKTISTEQEMIDFGFEIANNYSKIILYGDLGAGKTHFVKGFGTKIGISNQNIISPTYTYINEYSKKLLHIDMYRLENEFELIEKGILDKIFEYDYVCIEWGKFEELYLDKSFLKIWIDKISETQRICRY